MHCYLAWKSDKQASISSCLAALGNFSTSVFHALEFVLLQTDLLAMAEEDVQPLVCDNGSGMVKVRLNLFNVFCVSLIPGNLSSGMY